MTNQLLSAQWFEHQAKVTEAIGRPGFAASLFAALSVIRPIQATTVYLYPHDGMPCALFEQDDKAPWQPEGNVSRYLSGFYLLDPFYGACLLYTSPSPRDS